MSAASDPIIAQLERARVLMDEGEPDDAWKIVEAVLMDNPNDPRALMTGTHIQEAARRLVMAYQLAERGVRLAPNISQMWANFGRIADQLYRTEEAENAYAKALELAVKPAHKVWVLENMSALFVTMGRWSEAEKTAREALSISEKSRKAKCNLGIALLAQRKWQEGWKCYETYLGSPHRKLVQYGNEPQWRGEKNKVVAAYAEQGIGDELSFASMLPELIADSKKVIIECDKRLSGLFRRSFPEATVYGTRFVNGDNVQPTDLWAPADRKMDASVAMGALGGFYRLRDEHFPGTPYLKADPDRVMMWKSLFQAQGKPSIGIAWTGGVQWTGEKYRKWDLPGLYPLFLSADAHWVSLQYKDASKEIAEFHAEQDMARVHQYAYGTLTKDYDDTAALVSSLDLVICMQTAVAHLAGALGKECWVFVPHQSQWRYGSEGESIPWYKSVKVFRQTPDGSWPLGEASRMLRLRYGMRMAA